VLPVQEHIALREDFGIVMARSRNGHDTSLVHALLAALERISRRTSMEN
jgi:hypothetical protein